MSAQILSIYYLFVGIFILPFTLLNLVVLKTPKHLFIRPFVVVSGSMEPAVPTGSIIYTIPQSHYKKGDIVAFASNNESISHRIVGIPKLGSTSYFSTKGDANTLLDGDLVLPDSVYGKIVVVLSPMSMVLTGISLCLLFSFLFFRKRLYLALHTV